MSFVNVTTGENDASGTSIAAAAANHLAGHLLVAHVIGGSDTNFVNGLSDTAGNQWLQCANARASSVATGHIDTWYAKNITGNAANVVTASYPVANTFRRIIVHQYSRMDLLDPFDIAAIGSGTGTAALSAAFTTRRKNQVISAGMVGNADITWTPGTGYTLRSSVAGFDHGSEDKTVADIQTGVTANATASVSVDWLISVATFKEIQEVSGPTPLVQLVPEFHMDY